MPAPDLFGVVSSVTMKSWRGSLALVVLSHVMVKGCFLHYFREARDIWACAFFWRFHILTRSGSGDLRSNSVGVAVAVAGASLLLDSAFDAHLMAGQKEKELHGTGFCCLSHAQNVSWSIVMLSYVAVTCLALRWLIGTSVGEVLLDCINYVVMMAHMHSACCHPPRSLFPQQV